MTCKASCALEWSRTITAVRPHAPQACASTNSATRAKEFLIKISNLYCSSSRTITFRQLSEHTTPNHEGLRDTNSALVHRSFSVVETKSKTVPYQNFKSLL